MSTALEFNTGLHPLDDPVEWVQAPHYDPPCSAEDIARWQSRIDSVAGTTRDGKSIVKLVWNGDRRYWKEYNTEWNLVGEPTASVKRPQVLYKSVTDSTGKLLFDAFVPRWLLMTRIEPEQYVSTWKRDIMVYHPVLKRQVPVKPTTPPKEMYMWLQTIGEHNGHCCRLAAENEASCYGRYARPSLGIKNLEEMMAGVKESGIRNDPFASSSEVMRRLADREGNNYTEQALRRYQSQLSTLAEVAPLAFVTPKILESGASLGTIRQVARDRAQRMADSAEKRTAQRR